MISRALIALALLFFSAARAQVLPGRDIVEFDGDPAISAHPDRARIAAPGLQIETGHAAMETAIRALSGTVVRRYDTVFNGMAVQMPDRSAALLRGLPGVRGVYPPPVVPAVAARSQVLNVSPVGDIPGTYEIDVQLGRTSFTYDEFDS